MFSLMRSFLQKEDPELDTILKSYRDAPLLETYGERVLELVIAKAPCAEWVAWLFTSLIIAARADNIDVFQRLFALCVHDSKFWTPERTARLLTESGYCGSVAVLSALLKVDIFIAAVREVYEVGVEIERLTPVLVVAVMEGNPGCVSALVKAGAHLEQTGANGGTALGEAVDKGHEGIVLDPLAAGADVNNVKDHGPSTIATERGFALPRYASLPRKATSSW